MRFCPRMVLAMARRPHRDSWGRTTARAGGAAPPRWGGVTWSFDHGQQVIQVLRRDHFNLWRGRHYCQQLRSFGLWRDLSSISSFGLGLCRDLSSIFSFGLGLYRDFCSISSCVGLGRWRGNQLQQL